MKAGGTRQSPAGLLSIDEVVPIAVEEITAADARAAGYRSPGEVLADLRPDGQLYRIRFSRIGQDPRIALRQEADVDESAVAAARRLRWAPDVLRAVAAQPATVSTARWSVRFVVA